MPEDARGFQRPTKASPSLVKAAVQRYTDWGLNTKH